MAVRAALADDPAAGPRQVADRIAATLGVPRRRAYEATLRVRAATSRQARRTAGRAAPERAGTLPAVPPYYLTTPIYYVNDAPHVGHGVHDGQRGRLARWHRLLGRRRLVHDRVPTSTGPRSWRRPRRTARRPRSGRTGPRPASSRRGDRLDISYDDFIRTTEPRHYAVVQAVPPAHLRQRVHRAGALLGPLLRLLRGLLHRGAAGRRALPGAWPSRGGDAGGQLLLPAERSSSSGCSSTTRPPRLRPAGRRSATRRSGSSGAGCATSPSPGPRSPGACRCPGTAGTSSTSGTTR